MNNVPQLDIRAQSMRSCLQPVAGPPKIEVDMSAASESTPQTEVSINGNVVVVRDKTPTAGQLLTAGGFEPVDDHELIQKVNPGSRLVSLDETVDLRGREPKEFFAFVGGAAYTYTVDTHGYVWGAAQISEASLRSIANVQEDRVIVLGREGDDEVIEPGSSVTLRHEGVEHFRTESKLIEVFIDGVAKEVPRGTYTTEQLLTMLEVTPGYLLNIQRKNGLEPLKPGEKVRLKPGMKFFSQAPGGGTA